MNSERRKWIKNMAVLQAGWAFPSLVITSCEKENVFKSMAFNGRVCVIGGGLAGMYCTALLQKQKTNVVLLEASNRLGGRVLTNDTEFGFPIELGAEEIHGNKSILYDLLLQNGITPFDNDIGDNYYYINNQIRNEKWMNEQEQAATLSQAIESIANYSGAEQSVSSYLQGFIEPQFFNVANALIGNEYGTSNSRLGMKGIKQSEEIWTAGVKNFKINKGLSSLFNQVFGSAVSVARLNHVVIKINLSDNVVKVTYLNNGVEEVQEFDKVVVTVPISILSEWVENNVFEPALPVQKTEAMSKLGMDVGFKIFLKFSTRFWPEEMGSFYGGNVVPEYWTNSTPDGSHVLTAFVMGERAENLKTLGTGIIDAIRNELIQLYGSAAQSSVLLKHFIKDWSSEPFIKGAYSYPKLNAVGAREELAKPIDNQLYFAGEATNTNGHFATMHGAMETGYRAAIEILKS